MLTQNSVLNVNVKELLGTFNQEKALEGAFSVISNLWMELFEALLNTRSHHRHPADGAKN